MRLLALSSSRVANGGYLEAAAPIINDFLGKQPWKVAFIPFASVEKDYDEYHHMVQQALSHLPYTIQVAKEKNAKEVLRDAEVIMVGGGNTFKLLHDLYSLELLGIMKEKVRNGLPYIGWSAGSNIAGLTIGTTNDMPIIQPESFSSLGFLPFQINPHYLNENREGFHGETRDQRLTEYVRLNPGVTVVALPEGSALELNQNRLLYLGGVPAIRFLGDAQGKAERTEINPGSDLSHLI